MVCASVGFLSFVPTHYLGLAQLGIISALGMVAAFAVTLVLLPAMLAAWPPSGSVRGHDTSRFTPVETTLRTRPRQVQYQRR